VWHVHAAECCWPFSGTLTILEALAPLFAEERRKGADEALREAASELLAYSRELREAYREHNAGRDLSTRQPRRPDINQWANASEAAGHRLNRRADAYAEGGER
jgi:hypothetical protein